MIDQHRDPPPENPDLRHPHERYADRIAELERENAELKTKLGNTEEYSDHNGNSLRRANGRIRALQQGIHKRNAKLTRLQAVARAASAEGYSLPKLVQALGVLEPDDLKEVE